MNFPLRGCIFEDFVNYKKCCMTLIMPYCDFKCNKDCGKTICHNVDLIDQPIIEVDMNKLIEDYIHNPITHAVCFQGLEPFYSNSNYNGTMYVLDFINTLRVQYGNTDDVIVYTGYTENECKSKGIINLLKDYKNLIIKFGRYREGDQPHLDDLLGVKLASNNQYAKRIEYII